MFLTATPLRYSKKDLDIYPQIASNILYANNKDSLLKELTNELYTLLFFFFMMDMIVDIYYMGMS